MKATRVRFVGTHDGVLSLLAIETVDRPELTSRLADALFQHATARCVT